MTFDNALRKVAIIGIEYSRSIMVVWIRPLTLLVFNLLISFLVNELIAAAIVNGFV